MPRIERTKTAIATLREEEKDPTPTVTHPLNAMFHEPDCEGPSGPLAKLPRPEGKYIDTHG